MLQDPSNKSLPGEVEGILNDCQAQIQNMYVDVQILKDENYKDADSVYKT